MPETSIVRNPNKVLRDKAIEVPIADIKKKHIQEILARMAASLRDAVDGVGLAAPQIGESLRIFLVSQEAEEIDTTERSRPSDEDREKRKKKDWIYDVYINPIVKKISKRKDVYPEGCLSVPGVFGVVERPEKITVEAYDQSGKKFMRGASKFYARVIQHELDHINGTLFIDKVSRLLESERKTS